jgi:hypothetical protein
MSAVSYYFEATKVMFSFAILGCLFGDILMETLGLVYGEGYFKGLGDNLRGFCFIVKAACLTGY